MRWITVGIGIMCFIAVSCAQSTSFGENFEAADEISVLELFQMLDAGENTDDVVVTGTVEEVCQVKGCWMTLAADDDVSMRVSFKDYDFFVPKDIHGRTVVIKGKGEISITSVADLQHYAEDEGLSEEEIAAITEPKSEYTFVADGVKLMD